MDALVEVPEEETEGSGGMENGCMETGSFGGGVTSVVDQLRKLTLNKSSSSLSQQSGQQETEQQLNSVQEQTAEKLSSEQTSSGQVSSEVVPQNDQLCEKSSSTEPSISLPSTPQKDDKVQSNATPSISLTPTPQEEDKTNTSVTPSTSLPSSPQKDEGSKDVQASPNSATSPSNKKLDVSGSDQLRQLLLQSTNQAPAAATGTVLGRSPSPGLITGASSSPSGGEGMREGRCTTPTEEAKMTSTADAQVSESDVVITFCIHHL